jgi:hypothetical protein
MPGLAPVSWVLQTLGLFFFAGGFAAAHSHRRRTMDGPTTPRRRERRPGTLRQWPSRMRRPVVPVRLVRAVVLLLAFWGTALGIGVAIGTPVETLRTIAVLVVSPLWFLLPYVVLQAATPALVRVGPAVVAVPAIALVAASDAGLLPSWIAVLAAWAVPWVLGVALAAGRLCRGLPLALAGVIAMAALIGRAGYPVSAVGVPGDGRSNLSPPSLVAVALAATQIGIFLILRRWTRARSSRVISTRSHKIVAALNGSALPIYLIHQSVLIVVVVAVALVNPRMPGLLTKPDEVAWVAQRLLWLTVPATILGAVVAAATARRGRARQRGR